MFRKTPRKGGLKARILGHRLLEIGLIFQSVRGTTRSEEIDRYDATDNFLANQSLLVADIILRDIMVRK